MDTKETSVAVGRTNVADIKQELLDSEPPVDDSETKICEKTFLIMELPTTSEMKPFVSKNTVEEPLLISSDIKPEPKLSDDLELMKNIKQEPTDVGQTNSDVIAIQYIPERSEQHEMEDIKYVSTQNYLDIAESMISEQDRAMSEQDRAMSEQDRARPGPSSNGDVACQTSKSKNKESTLFAGRKNDKKIICGVCGFKVRQRIHLMEHMQTHTTEKTFECDVCDWKFKRLVGLKRHIMRKHTEEKPYECEICDYKCAERSNLKGHMRTHTGEKPYKCEICVFKCGHKSSIERHMRTHTGEKPYKCEICDYQCRHLSTLKRHLLTHSGEKPYKCEICDYPFRQLSTLKTHMKTHTEKKPFKCEGCDWNFRSLGNLKRHLGKH